MNIKLNFKQQGYLLIVAIFIVLVLSTMAMGVLLQYQYALQDVTRELQYHRSYYAAQSAIELAKKEFELTGNCEDKQYHFDQGFKALNGFHVNLTCSVIKKGNEIKHSHIAIAEFGSFKDPYYVKKIIERIE